jgi:S-adenosylmethionine:tRNA ribosyltransferase-isomerase
VDNPDQIQEKASNTSIPDYVLPPERIAEHPLPERDGSKLLVAKGDQFVDSSFSELSNHLPPGSTLVLNNTRVIEARIFFQKPTGGVIEVFCLEPFFPRELTSALGATEKCQWQCLIGGASKWKSGQVLEKKLLVNGVPTTLFARYVEKRSDHFIIEFSWEQELNFAEVLHAAGTIPLPPYIKREVVANDSERYQTVFNQTPGSVAAPTASLHFTDTVFRSLDEKGITKTYLTLNVGAGTFMPVKTTDLKAHQMHPEVFSVTKKTLEELLKAEIIVAAGTTTLRTLESLYWLAVKMKKDKSIRSLGQWEAYELNDDLSYAEALEWLIQIIDSSGSNSLDCSTSLLIMPGYRFKSAHALITNFHQPKSTLLALVAAFVGEKWKSIYDHALVNEYRFLSYGDSSLLWRRDLDFNS